MFESVVNIAYSHGMGERNIARDMKERVEWTKDYTELVLQDGRENIKQVEEQTRLKGVYITAWICC